MTELAIDRHRIILHLAYPRMARRRRHQQRIDGLEQGRGDLPVFGQPVLGAEQVFRAPGRRLAQHPMHHGIHLCRLLEQTADRDPAFGHPGALVEQFGRGMQRRRR